MSLSDKTERTGEVRLLHFRYRMLDRWLFPFFERFSSSAARCCNWSRHESSLLQQDLSAPQLTKMNLSHQHQCEVQGRHFFLVWDQVDIMQQEVDNVRIDVTTILKALNLKSCSTRRKELRQRTEMRSATIIQRWWREGGRHNALTGNRTQDVWLEIRFYATLAPFLCSSSRDDVEPASKDASYR